jgi:uncharacterized membrane protein
MEQQQQIEALEKQLQSLLQQVTTLEQEVKALKQSLQSPAHAPVTPAPRNAATAVPGSSRLENFIGLKFIHLAGIIVLVTGLSIGVKYAIDQNLISPVTRIILAYLAGLVLYGLSVQLKKLYNLFSAILFSGGMASLYFTTYGACVYYNLLPGWLAFALMVLMTIYTAYTAIRYNRQEIAVLGIVGAYGIPFLVSRNNDAVVLFFSYILLTNIAVVYLSFRRSWKIMSQLAMVTTWLLFLSWCFFRYHPKDQPAGIAFMLLFYVLFQLSALAFRLGKQTPLNFTEGVQLLLNNTALYVASLLLFQGDEHRSAAALITGVFALLFFAMGFLFHRLLPAETTAGRNLLLQAILALLLFTALEWKGFPLTLVWLFITAVLFVAGVATGKAWPRLAAVALCCITLVKLVLFDSERFTTLQKILCYIIIGTLLLALSFFYQKFKTSLFGEEEKKNGTRG